MAHTAEKKKRERHHEQKEVENTDEKKTKQRKKRERHHEQEEVQNTDENKTKRRGFWGGIDLALAIKNKTLPVHKKIELAFDFLSSEDSYKDQGTKRFQVSGLVSSVSSWVQSVLISSDNNKKSLEFLDPCIDFRCWVVLKFCIEKSSSSVSFNLLRAITHFAKHTLLILDGDDALQGQESTRLFDGVYECLSLIFSSNGKVFKNAGMELWVSCAAEIVGLVCRIFANDGHGSTSTEVLLSLSDLLLEHFTSFLRFHPNPRSIFRVFVDRLLERLLESLVLLYLQSNCGKIEHVGSLLRKVEDVLSNGLFHLAHVDGFLSLRSSIAKKEVRELKGFIESYHRHFFQKLEQIIAEKKALALGGFGHLLRLFVTRVRTRKGASLPSKGDWAFEKSRVASEEAKKTSEPLFEVFVQFMKPLVLECKRCAEKEFAKLGEFSELRVVEIHCILKSVNAILVSFMHQRIYMRTEDTSEGSHFNFLTEIYDTVISVSVKMYRLSLSTLHVEDARPKKMLLLIAREVFVAVGYLLEIEYKVVGDDLVKLWLIMLSHSGVYMSNVDTKSRSLLTSEILNFGCQLITVYSELRQVNNPIFGLCKAVRFVGFSDAAGQVGYSKFVSSMTLSSDMCSETVAALLCSQEFRLAISNAIKSIPEGQASGCIQQLKLDVADSLEWMRFGSLRADGEKSGETNIPNSSILVLDLQVELLGRILSEIYAIVLDSLTVTTTNSVSVGNSIKDLMKVIGPSFSYLVENRSDNVDGFFYDEFFYSVTGRRLSNHNIPERETGLSTSQMSTPWAFVFFFRMYVSCRSLYQQLLNLMPPHSSKKASEAMGNKCTISCGMDWTERSDCMDEGYFSWIVKPSVSLLDVIHSLSEGFISSKFSGCASLVYVSHVMVLQRLVYLNRQIKAFEFLQERDARLVQIQLLDNAGIHKASKKWKQLISSSLQEAALLTNFVTRYLPLLTSEGHSSRSDETGECKETLPMYEDAWDLGVCSLNEKLLPTAIWWLLCRNTDIWCAHAAKKNLKRFLSLLFHHSLPFVSSSLSDVGKQCISGPFCPRTVTMHQISWELLSDTVLYEQKVLYSHFTSRFCHILKKSLAPMLSHSCASNVDFSSLSDWSEVLNILEKRPVVNMNDGHALHHISSMTELNLVTSKAQVLKHCDERQSFSSFSAELRTCECLLNLLCRLPSVHVNDRSFSLYSNYILNLERLVISNILNNHSKFPMYDIYQLFRLFVACRRALKYLVMAAAEENLGVRQSSFISIAYASSSVSWLVKSVTEVVGLSFSFLDMKYSSQVKDLFFPLMDHTSYIFLIVSERQIVDAMPFLIEDEKIHREVMHDRLSEQDTFVEADQYSDSSEHSAAWKYTELMAETLKEQTKILLITMKSSLRTVQLEAGINVINWNKFSSMISCLQGFLWGLASALNSIYEDRSMENSLQSRLIFWSLSKLNNCITVFEEFISLCLNVLLIDDYQLNEVLCKAQNLSEQDCHDDLSSLDVPVDNATEFSCCEIENCSVNYPKTEKQGRRADFSRSNYDHDHENPSGYTKTSSFMKQRSSFVPANSAVNVLTDVKIDSSKLQHSDGSLLHSLLKGDSPQIAFTLRQLFIASAAILKLKCISSSPRALGWPIDSSPLASSSIGILVETSHFVLLEMAQTSGRPDPFSFVWLDGILRYLEVVGSYFYLTHPALSRNLYAQLIDVQLRAIGKCISLQGKAATLSSHETGSTTKMLQFQKGCDGSDMQSFDCTQGSINTFKARLRMSFKNFIRRPLELHLFTAVKALERALSGVRQGCNVVCEINTGNLDGGRVSSVVASGIDCLDLVLESVEGHKLLGIKKHIPNFVAAILNIVLHLQSPTIFYQGNPPHNKSEVSPDPGSVILMCVEVLTKVAGRHSMFKMDSFHVSQCLHIPMTLFQHFHQLRVSRIAYHSLLLSRNQESGSMANMNHYTVDRQFSVDIYAACCRLLCTTVTHWTSEVGRCVTVLEYSVRTLLSCLETVESNLVSEKGCFAWEIQEAIQCASFLRRIYEEIRQQKDILGRYSSDFLSSYIRIYSGCGPLKTGIKREIDEALRPGVYSLIDICTRDDLQQLHTVLGEGPCRSTLATLRHDYGLNFQYEGKI